MTLIGTGLGKKALTGHPVMVVGIVMMVVDTHAGIIIRLDELTCSIVLPAFICEERNNEMIGLFAKYFL
jgi:hypothetical protein